MVLDTASQTKVELYVCILYDTKVRTKRSRHRRERSGRKAGENNAKRAEEEQEQVEEAEANYEVGWTKETKGERIRTMRDF